MNHHQPTRRQARTAVDNEGLERDLAGVTLDLKRLRKDPRHTIKGGWRRMQFGRTKQ